MTLFRVLALSGLAVGLLAARGANAVVIAAEHFNYADGAVVGNGGAADGWAGAWRLGCCQEDLYQIVGGQLTADGEASRIHRDLAAPLGADNTSLFIGLDYQFGGFFNGFEMHSGADDDNSRWLSLGYEGSQQLDLGDEAIDTIDFADVEGLHRFVIALSFGTAGGDSAELFIDGDSVGSTSLTEEFFADRVAFGSFVDPGMSIADRLVIADNFSEANSPDLMLACDFDGDGDCDSVDFGILRDNMYTAGTFAEGDVTGNGFIDLADYRFFKDDPNRVVGVISGASAANFAVPEPCGLAVCVVAMGGAGLRRPRRLSAAT